MWGEHGKTEQEGFSENYLYVDPRTRRTVQNVSCKHYLHPVVNGLHGYLEDCRGVAGTRGLHSGSLS
jgi:hypothetical protein